MNPWKVSMRSGLTPWRVAPPLTLAACVALAMLAGEARAEDVLFDPENPASQEPEIVVDPENIVPPMAQVGPAAAVDRPTWRSATLSARLGTMWMLDTAFESPGEDMLEGLTHARMALDMDVSPLTRARLEGHLWHWTGFRQSPHGWPAGREDSGTDGGLHARASAETWLGEAWLLHRPGRWSLQAGQFATRWGSTDITRPGDVISPVDLRHGPLTPEGLALRPQPALSAAYAFDGATLTGLVVPFFTPNRLPLLGRDFSLVGAQNPLAARYLPVAGLVESLADPSTWHQLEPVLGATEVPRPDGTTASVGARLTAVVANTDLGAGAFWGWDRTPWLQVDPDLREVLRTMVEDGQVLADLDFLAFAGREPQVVGALRRVAQRRESGEEVLSARYRRRFTVVLDAARYLGPLGVRADVALSPGQVFYTRELEARRRPSAHAALGLSWEHLDGDRPLVVTLEGYWLGAAGARSWWTRNLVAEGEAGAPGEELLVVQGGYYGLAAALAWSLPGLEATDLRLGANWSASLGDVAAQVALERSIGQGLRARIGGLYFAGPDPARTPSPGGLFDDNDAVFAAFEASF